MTTRQVLLWVAAVAVSTPLYSQAESLNLKTGAWEMTTTTSTGGLSLPVETLDKLSDAQRARLESAMQARAGKPETFVSKSCVTQADLNQNSVIKSDDETICNQKILSQSARRMEIEQTCGTPQSSVSKMVIEAESPDSMSAHMDMTKPGTRSKVHIDIKGRWLSSSCAGVTEGG